MDNTEVFAFLDHVKWLVEQGPESDKISLEQVQDALRELDERFEGMSNMVKMLNGERARLTKLLATEATTPTIPADPVVPFAANTLTAASAVNPLAPVPATTVAPGAPVASADVDATNAASTKGKKSLSAIRRQRLRSRTVTERRIKKKQGDSIDN
ncbi:hypothetical protein GGH94_005201 [Coemansia aciculifera]|uniref:Uncharacterized protein n=1 Tax=Coemansia aciculifera TaxID=417176 RepID=A0A9W8IDX7_9FUNG|nr:hypothetical protein GGH94_005201 [Coemansia aciculifera]KAJ2870440.1 hypothetical protein GGH93_005570 [Coemansia aciculifera]